MRGIYIRENSPFYWFCYYDKNEPDPKKRRKSISTKIEITQADQKRIKQGCNYILQGTPNLRELLKQFRNGLFENETIKKSGIKLKRNIKLSEGLKEYLFFKPQLKPRTIEVYNYAATKMITATTDKEVYRYSNKDYVLLIRYCTEQKFSETSMAIITRHLHPLWNWFVKQKYASENIIHKLKTPKGTPHPIPPKELRTILSYYEEKGIPSQEFAVKFFLFTGFRPSTAIIQTWENIDLDNDIMIAMNVKANRPFVFPIHKELKKLLEARPKKTGSVLGYKTKDCLDFFHRDMKKLIHFNFISFQYTLYNLRDTFASHLANNNLDMSNVQEIMNHSDPRITRGHYALVQTKYLRKKIDQANFTELVRIRDMWEQIDEDVEETEKVLQSVLQMNSQIENQK
jgi:integrase